MHGRRMVIQDKFNRRMGRGHSINLYSILKSLLHTVLAGLFDLICKHTHLASSFSIYNRPCIVRDP